MTDIKDYSTELACALNGYRALLIPDLHNADVTHWQSYWERNIPGARRILLHDWHSPNWVKWRNSIIASLITIDEPLVIIAEGFGALAAASVAAEYPGKIIALLLVNPADPDIFDLRKKLPRQSLPIPARVITNDKSDEAKAAYLALLWGADFAQVAGKVSNSFWPEAIDELQELVGKTQRTHQEILRLQHRKLSRYQARFNINSPIAFAS